MAKRFKHRFHVRYLLILSFEVNWNADHDNYEYSDYGIGFDAPSHFSLPDSSWAKMS